MNDAEFQIERGRRRCDKYGNRIEDNQENQNVEDDVSTAGVLDLGDRKRALKKRGGAMVRAARKKANRNEQRSLTRKVWNAVHVGSGHGTSGIV